MGIFDFSDTDVIVETTLDDWHSNLEDCIDWDSWDNLSQSEILYMGHAFDESDPEKRQIIMHRLTIEEDYFVTVESLGIHSTPESAMRAAKIGYYHVVAEQILDYFKDSVH